MDAFFKETLEQLTYQTLVEKKHKREGDLAHGGKGRRSQRVSSHEGSESAFGKNTSENSRSVSKKGSVAATKTPAGKDKMPRVSMLFRESSKRRVEGASL